MKFALVLVAAACSHPPRAPQQPCKYRDCPPPAAQTRCSSVPAMPVAALATQGESLIGHAIELSGAPRVVPLWCDSGSCCSDIKASLRLTDGIGDAHVTVALDGLVCGGDATTTCCALPSERRQARFAGTLARDTTRGWVLEHPLLCEEP